MAAPRRRWWRVRARRRGRAAQPAHKWL